jgi:hypothetical protein
MRIALVEAIPNATYFPISLLKIGAWLKSEGHKTALFRDTLPSPGAFDEIWVSTLFTYQIPHSLGIVRAAVKRTKRVRVGGVAATLLPEKFRGENIFVHQGLLPEVEDYEGPPDYSLLDYGPVYSIAHTSRGCVRKCGFCMVSTLEPKFQHRTDWSSKLIDHPDANRILFYDNNWLAKPVRMLREDTEQIRRLMEERKGLIVDFNQGLDCRLLTEEKADLVAGIPIRPVRFAFDSMEEDGHFQRATELMIARGHKEFIAYVLYNFNDSPEDFYYRLKETPKIREAHNTDSSSFPMKYRPIMEAEEGNSFVGSEWTERMLRAFKVIMKNHSTLGTVSCKGGSEGLGPVGEFEYWFGKDAGEFKRLLMYPKIDELMAKRKGSLRLVRAEKRPEGRKATANFGRQKDWKTRRDQR